MITDPIDMLTIEANIKSDKYTSEEEIIADFKVRILLLILKCSNILHVCMLTSFGKGNMSILDVLMHLLCWGKV